MKALLVSALMVIFLNATYSARTKRPLLLISCDGFRADKFDAYLRDNPNSNFRSLVDTGVKAEFMK